MLIGMVEMHVLGEVWVTHVWSKCMIFPYDRLGDVNHKGEIVVLVERMLKIQILER